MNENELCSLAVLREHLPYFSICQSKFYSNAMWVLSSVLTAKWLFPCNFFLVKPIAPETDSHLINDMNTKNKNIKIKWKRFSFAKWHCLCVPSKKPINYGCDGRCAIHVKVVVSKSNWIFQSVTFDWATVSARASRLSSASTMMAQTRRSWVGAHFLTWKCVLIRSIYFAIIHIELGPILRRRSDENHFQNVYTQNNPTSSSPSLTHNVNGARTQFGGARYSTRRSTRNIKIKWQRRKLHNKNPRYIRSETKRFAHKPHSQPTRVRWFTN